MPGRFPSQASCSCNIERSTPRSGVDPEIPERGSPGKKIVTRTLTPLEIYFVTLR